MKFKNIITDKVMIFAVLSMAFIYVDEIEYEKRFHKNLDYVLKTEIKAEILKVNVSRSYVDLQLSNHKPISFSTTRYMWFENNDVRGDSVFKASGLLECCNNIKDLSWICCKVILIKK